MTAKIYDFQREKEEREDAFIDKYYNKLLDPDGNEIWHTLDPNGMIDK